LSQPYRYSEPWNAGLSVRFATLAQNIYFELSTQTIVHQPSGVQNKDMPTSVKSCLQRDVANFSDAATGIGVHCAPVAVRTVRSNKNPGIAAGVLHSLN
jgi:hypothetical protein